MVNDVSLACFCAQSWKPTLVQIGAEGFEVEDDYRCVKLSVNVRHEASRRKLAEVLHKSSQGKKVFTTSPCSTYLLSYQSKIYDVRAR